MSEITFEKIQKEQDVDQLFKMKLELTEDTSDLHIDLHDGNVQMRKSEIIAEINRNKELIDYLQVRIKDRRQEIYIAEKELRHSLRKFKDAAKLILPVELYSKIELEAKKL